MERYYDRVYKTAKKVAFLYVKNADDVEDIIQLTIMQFYLNKDKVIEENIYNWVFTVTKNFCMQYFRSRNKENELKKSYVIEASSNFSHYDNLGKENEDKLAIIDIDQYGFINNKDKVILKEYIDKHKSISKLSKSYKVKKKTLQNRINLLLKEIKLYHIIKSQPHVFDALPGTKLSRNINNFLKTITQAIEANELDKLKHYLSDCKINDSINNLRVKEVSSYRIQIVASNIYMLIVGFIDLDDQVKFFMARFKLINNYTLKFIEFPIFPKRVVALDKKYAEGKEGLKRLSDDRGASNMMFGNPDAILKKGMGKVVQTENEFKPKNKAVDLCE